MLLWIRLPRLPLEMWNEKVLRHILTPISRLYKVDHNFDETSKALFARVCVEVDINKPLKMKTKYIQNGIIYECFLDCENITSICSGYHRPGSCVLNSKSLAFKVEKLPEMSQIMTRLF